MSCYKELDLVNIGDLHDQMKVTHVILQPIKWHEPLPDRLSCNTHTHDLMHPTRGAMFLPGQNQHWGDLPAELQVEVCTTMGKLYYKWKAPKSHLSRVEFTRKERFLLMLYAARQLKKKHPGIKLRLKRT